VGEVGAVVPAERLEAGPGEFAPSAEETFVHRATRQNIAGNSTYLYHPRLNDAPDARLSVTEIRNPDGTTTRNGYRVGVWYDSRTGRWAILDQNRLAMAEGTSFEVVVRGTP
jgi:hypothetical protein